MHPADVLVGSHTHWPLRHRWGRYQVLNTGAVGVPFNGDGRAQYLWLTLENGAWTATFRRVAYDVREALAAYASRGYLEAGGLLARLFRDEVRDARSYLVPFQMWAEAQGASLDEAGFAAFRAARPERFGPPRAWPTVTASGAGTLACGSARAARCPLAEPRAVGVGGARPLSGVRGARGVRRPLPPARALRRLRRRVRARPRELARRHGVGLHGRRRRDGRGGPAHRAGPRPLPRVGVGARRRPRWRRCCSPTVRSRAHGCG